jgi:voltage-gated potassium channel
MSEGPARPAIATTLRHRWRFAGVLAASLLLAVAEPLTSGLIGGEGPFDVFFSLLIAAVLLLVFEERQLRRMAMSLGLAAFVGIWVGHGVGGPVGRVLLVGAYLLAAGFFGLALYGILRAIFVRQVTGDAIFGAVCGYLLLGIIWSLLYYAVETAAPGSFNLPASRGTADAAAHLDRGSLSYYSFITLATVGYGDITPHTPLARTLAWLEAIVGQFYLAILVAGLVGFIVTQAMNDETKKRGES